jgi:hypothetical protein
MMTICWYMSVEAGVFHPSNVLRLFVAGTNAHDSACTHAAAAAHDVAQSRFSGNVPLLAAAARRLT